MRSCRSDLLISRISRGRPDHPPPAVTRGLLSLPIPTDGTAGSVLPVLLAAFEGGPVVEPIEPGTSGAADVLADPDDDEDDPTVVVLRTSGSTGGAKQVLLQASALRASAAATQRHLGGPGSWLLTLPGWHVAGLQVILRSQLAATDLVAMDTRKPFTALAFIDAARRLQDDRRYVSLVPTQLHRILEDPAAGDVLAGFDRVLVGGAATAPELLSRARVRGIAVVTTYGMSETCGGCVYDGRPLDITAVGLTTDGRITLTGPMVARGYRGRPAAAAFAVPGTFITDDLGTLTAGRLTVLGRADDMIITGGVNVPPAAVEQRLAGITGIGEVLVVGVPDPEWGRRLIALVTGAAPAADQLAEALHGAPAAHRPREFLKVASLPSRGPGKPDRRAAAALAADLLGLPEGAGSGR